MTWQVRAILLAAVLAGAASAAGQQIVTLEFSYSNPGARSLGLGGAFVALADDATAAYANPAGLVQIVRREVSVEGRSWSYSTPFTAGGRADGAPTGLGIDTDPGLRLGESSGDFGGLSFLSFVYPRKRWTFAFHRHQLADFESSSSTNGLFAQGDSFAGTDRWNDAPGSGRLAVVSYTFSAGYRLNDALSLGIGASLLDVDLRTESAGYLPDDDSIDGFFAPNSFLPDRQIWRFRTDTPDPAGQLILGLLWRVSDRWRIGAAHRSRPKPAWSRELVAGPAAPEDFPEFSSRIPWTFPDVLSLGVAYRSPDGRLAASFEWDRVRYSLLLEGFVVAITARELQFTSGELREEVPDAEELHLGLEYAFLRSKPLLALRLGAWLDPDHRIRATRGNALVRAILPPGEDELHYSAGLGLAFKTFQIDLAVDLSDRIDTASLSAVYSF